ncbi:MAG: YjjG family noncanonical pyrimidine nucleotidase [Clostridia bacterium]|nr:YjjG family noncanonical pyrimidine nucleotidase [Clostridia bacterium]
MYTSLFLDLDNTLLDFQKAEAVAIKKVLISHNLPHSEKDIKTYSAINLSYWKRFERGEIPKSAIFEGRFATLLEYFGTTGDIESISKQYFEELSEGYFKVDFAEDILCYLKSRGYKLYATTNGIAQTQFKRIKNSKIEPFFDAVFVSENVGHQKPKKEYFECVINNIEEKDRSKMLIIGDSQSSDILGGLNSGIDTCWYNPENETAKYPSKYEISSLLAIKTLL